MTPQPRSLPAGLATAILLTAAIILSFCPRASAQNKACSLATPEELQAALGAKVSGLTGHSRPGGADICTGSLPGATVSLRLARRSPESQGKEVKGIEAVKKMGAQVEVKTDGPITCSTLIPPPNLPQMGFNTTCSVLKNGQVAAIEVTAKSRKDMATMDSLHKVAEKMAGSPVLGK
jgi:hypothetical protein